MALGLGAIFWVAPLHSSSSGGELTGDGVLFTGTNAIAPGTRSLTFSYWDDLSQTTTRWGELAGDGVLFNLLEWIPKGSQPSRGTGIFRSAGSDPGVGKTPSSWGFLVRLASCTIGARVLSAGQDRSCQHAELIARSLEQVAVCIDTADCLYSSRKSEGPLFPGSGDDMQTGSAKLPNVYAGIH